MYFIHISIIPYLKKFLEWSVKKFWNAFLEMPYSSNYWTKKHDNHFKWKLKPVWLTEELIFEIWFGKIWEIEISKDDRNIFLQIIPRFFLECDEIDRAYEWSDIKLYKNIEKNHIISI